MNNNYPRFFKKIPNPQKRHELILLYQSGDKNAAMQQAYAAIHSVQAEDSTEFKTQVWNQVFTEIFKYL